MPAAEPRELQDVRDVAEGDSPTTSGERDSVVTDAAAEVEDMASSAWQVTQSRFSLGIPSVGEQHSLQVMCDRCVGLVLFQVRIPQRPTLGELFVRHPATPL